MIIGTGIDLVDIERIQGWLDNRPLMTRYFSDSEIDYVLSRGKSAAPSLAARFAAKEAFGKALGTGLKGITLKDIEVILDSNGKPELILRGSAEDALLKNKGGRVFLSLSHDSTLSVAQVIIEEALSG
jgi:holo-[acyl-carrier protein] synthase